MKIYDYVQKKEIEREEHELFPAYHGTLLVCGVELRNERNGRYFTRQGLEFGMITINKELYAYIRNEHQRGQLT